MSAHGANEGVGHVVIRASAGSGKTYRLTGRYIQLMAMGVPPERIVALTFTRKAAGEFLDRTLTRLAEAAEDAGAARRLRQETGVAEADFAALLEVLVRSMHRVFLGTLDSFFYRALRLFALDLGLSGNFEILQGYAETVEKRRVLQDVFRGGGGGQDDFFEAFKLATVGTEESRVAKMLDGLFEGGHGRLLEVPDGALWGNLELIWPDDRSGNGWFVSERGDAGRLGDALLAAGVEMGATAAAEKKLKGIAEALAGYDPAGGLVSPLTTLVNPAMADGVWAALAAGRAQLKFSSKVYDMQTASARAWRAAVAYVIGQELRRVAERTRGIHKILAGYEERHDRVVRRRGRLTFSDFTTLLGGQSFGESEVAFRMDGRYDHWLLDEFQDTSRAQWAVLEPMVEEVIQDTGGRRSYFQVGDTKQAIYGWRGGDVRLFGRVEERFGREAVGHETLHQSWRSAPPVIGFVNRLFGGGPALHEVVPDATADAWDAEWDLHESAKPELPGHVRCIVASSDEGPRGVGHQDVFREVMGVIEEIDPVGRGLSVAVLVQRKAFGKQVVDYLRAHGEAPVIMEADVEGGADNPVTAALLALFKAAAHPGDTLAWQHIAMTPLQRALEAAAPEAAGKGARALKGAVVRLVLREVARWGIEAAVWRWRDRLEKVHPLDPFSAMRVGDLAGAAQDFDASGGRDLGEFVAFASGYSVREADLSGVVRVMTVHAAKGLDFDAVILPDLEKEFGSVRDSLPQIHRGDTGDPEWVLTLPNKDYRSHDPVLAAHYDAACADDAYERLCVAYVAMTRAKQGLYTVTRPPESRQAWRKNATLLLEKVFGDEASGEILFENGRRDWWADHAPGGGESPAAPPTARPDGAPSVGHARRFERLARITPSGSEEFEVAGDEAFAARSRDARDFGTAVHALFENIEWTGDTPSGHAPEEASGDPPDEAAAVRRCLADPLIRSHFERTDRADRVWRERGFEAVIDEKWITGTFDRVVLRADGSVIIVDFKTDRVADRAEAEKRAAKYRPQMALYRQVIAMLLGDRARNVCCVLVFTALPTTVEI
ncbi:double-strand break repair helicase AddA [soil metagenome]